MASGAVDSTRSGSGAYTNVDIFASRVLTDLMVSKGGGSLNSSSVSFSDDCQTGKKKQKSVRLIKLLRLDIGDGISMAEAPYFVEKALVGHARGRNLNTGFLNRWLEHN